MAVRNRDSCRDRLPTRGRGAQPLPAALAQRRRPTPKRGDRVANGSGRFLGITYRLHCNASHVVLESSLPMPPGSGQPTNAMALAQRVLDDPGKAIAALQIGNGQHSIQALEQKRGTRVLSLMYSETYGTPLAFAVIAPLEAALSEMGVVPKLDLLLRSTGGTAEIPWRIVSLLREFSTDALGVLVSRVALSGSCHIAIAADELVMGPLSFLGPVDPTRDHPLLPKDANGKTIPTSVQDLKHCMQFVREQLGDAYPSQNLALIISELFKHVNPLSIGAIEQTYNLSRLITRKVLKTHKQPMPDEQIAKVVDALAGQYFSHTYPISRDEAEKDLGLNITKPDATLVGLIRAIENQYEAEFAKTVPFQANNPEPQLRVSAILETASSGWATVQVLAKDRSLVADPWLKFR